MAAIWVFPSCQPKDKKMQKILFYFSDSKKINKNNFIKEWWPLSKPGNLFKMSRILSFKSFFNLSILPKFALKHY